MQNTRVRAALVAALAAAVVSAGCFRRGTTVKIAPPPAQQGGQQAVAPNGEQPPIARPGGEFAELYGETGGEAVWPAGQSPPDSPLRARKGDTFYKLSNARAEPVGRQPVPMLYVDYETLSAGPYNGVSLVYKRGDGPVKTYLLAFPLQQKGTIEVALPFGTPQHPVVPKDAELYLTRGEHRYGNGFFPNFKVSNSTMIGQMAPTQARDWSADEAAKLRQPPPEGPKPNANPNVGQDTELAGDKVGGGSFRFAEAGKPMLGVEFGLGEWDNERCIGGLVPVYEEKQPVTPASTRVLAKPGYAVGGMTVRTQRYVNAVQLTFMKRGADGKLDPKDSYTSPWLGIDNLGGQDVKLGGDGRTVIGLHLKKGAIVNAVALVMEK